MSTITKDDIELLLTLFSRKGQYDASKTGEQSNEIHLKCEELFEKDYVCSKVNNEKGALSTNYPSCIIIPAEEKSPECKDAEFSKSSDMIVNFFDVAKYKDIANKSNFARCRTRFPVPVILCEGKFVCRSATLACGGEMFWRDMGGCIFNSSSSSDFVDKNSSQTRNGALFTELRSRDIKLLNELSVSYICDLMVENKKVKYGLKVSSSEKIDKENRYCDFKIVQLPYPGCEFFKKFKDSNYVAEGLMFDWEQNYVDSSLTLPSDAIVAALKIQWSNYKMWDLVKLTQNYLKLLLSYISEGTSSILIHCISGWDRTPLFISLLRMSLWADGKAHTSLSAVEMAYLTLAYDWYLFGHDLPSRLKSGEEILFFCFEFLKFITSEEFSTLKRYRKTSSNCTEPPLDVLIEEESPTKSSLSSSASSSSLHKPENGSTSIFYRSLNCSQDNVSPAVFPSSPDSDESDSVKSIKSNVQNDTSSSHSGTPSIISTLENIANNNGHPKSPTSSSPVPVPNCRQRMDSMSSFGSWQHVNGTGSLVDSYSSRSSADMINGTCSNHNLCQENGNIGGCSPSLSEVRAEKLKAIRTLMNCAYRKAIESKDSSNGERSSYFPWRR